VTDRDFRRKAAIAYVLGLMEGNERRRFEDAIMADGELAALVWLAEERLRPLAEAIPPRRPPPRVRTRIRARIFQSGEQRPDRPRRLAALRRILILLAALAAVAAVPLALAFLLQPDSLMPR
jgi:anti-sigma-K factor RskA